MNGNDGNDNDGYGDENNDGNDDENNDGNDVTHCLPNILALQQPIGEIEERIVNGKKVKIFKATLHNHEGGMYDITAWEESAEDLHTAVT